jgi:diadenosine tetraphosphatase ApaH/serine/threonine PP2A family protein phosphatase
MKYAVISDVHANLEALTACMDEIDKLKPDRVICLGDLVDYCAEPNETVEIIRSRCDIVILGNHDEAQFNYTIAERFREFAKKSSIHTRSVLKPGYTGYFKSLPVTHSENNILFVHASPSNPKSYTYVRDKETAQQNFESFSEGICFIGHSHVPLIWRFDGNEVYESDEGTLNISSSRYIINVGSIGQPRDNNPKASFGLYDTETCEYKNIRVEYDVKSASDKILKEGLPEFLAERLFTGT